MSDDDLRRSIGADIGRRVEAEPGRGYYIVSCGWCHAEINPGSGFCETPRIGSRGFHFSCIEAVGDAMRSLAANLSQAAGLQLSYRFGARWPYYLDYEDLTDDYSWSEAGSDAWRPGCQRPAPGYVEKLEVGR